LIFYFLFLFFIFEIQFFIFSDQTSGHQWSELSANERMTGFTEI